MRISIVVRALNEAAHLPRLLDDCASQSLSPDEIVLVDSGSTDATVHIAETAGASVVHIPPGDFTFGRALNVGCERAKGDVLVFASAHVYPVDRWWLERLTAPFEQPAIGLSYGGQDGDHRSNYAEIQLMKRWFPHTTTLDQRDPFCNNANCAIRRDDWEQHPFDEDVTGLEDIAWAKRLLDRGGRIAYVGDARIVHVHREHFDQIRNRYRREAMAYAEIFGGGDLGLAHSAALLARNLAADFHAARSEGALLSGMPQAAKFRVAQFWGAYQGHRSPQGTRADVVRRMYYPRPAAERRSAR